VNRISWKQWIMVALAVALGWGLRGQHGHERGAAIAGAMAGLGLAAVTGGPRWMGAAVLGSLGFAIGGSLSYGRFISLAYAGSWEAVAALVFVGLSWGGLGSLTLGIGLSLPKYRLLERIFIIGGLFLVWVVVDHLLWGRLTGSDDLRTRELMILLLGVVWGLLLAYVGIVRRDHTSIKLAVAGGIGFAVGFPLAAWVQGAGSSTGIPLNWWKIGEHLIGFCGGAGLGWAALRQKGSWVLPLPVRPWERWWAMAWLIWFLPSWQLANNLDYWISERALFPLWLNQTAAIGSFLFLLALGLWGWTEIRRGRVFATSWMPRHLRRLFLIFLWLTTAIACSKTAFVGVVDPPVLGFLLLALVLTWLVRTTRVTPA